MSNTNCEFCGKARFDINWTNWKRHTNACAKKKLKPYTETSETISKTTEKLTSNASWTRSEMTIRSLSL